MEDEKRKKKNKKKKNKQHKASEGPAVGVEETIAALDENHSSTQTHRDQNLIVDVQNGEVQKGNVDLNGHCANGIDSVSAALSMSYMAFSYVDKLSVLSVSILLHLYLWGFKAIQFSSSCGSMKYKSASNFPVQLVYFIHLIRCFDESSYVGLTK